MIVGRLCCVHVFPHILLVVGLVMRRAFMSSLSGVGVQRSAALLDWCQSRENSGVLMWLVMTRHIFHYSYHVTLMPKSHDSTCIHYPDHVIPLAFPTWVT